MPATVESQSNRAAKRGSSSQGWRKPGDWAPWPGATITSTMSTLPGHGPDLASGAHENRRANFVGFLQRTAGLAAQHQRDLQRERVARVGGGEPGQVGGLAQPVADRVRVHEQGPRGRLDRRAVLEVRRQGLDERAPGVEEREVDL